MYLQKKPPPNDLCMSETTMKSFRWAVAFLLFQTAQVSAVASEVGGTRSLELGHVRLVDTQASVATDSVVPTLLTDTRLQDVENDPQPIVEAPVSVPVSAPVRVMPPPLVLAFTPEDRRVSEALNGFLQRQGWQLAWEIDRDFPIDYPATFSGSLFDIVEQVVVALQNSDAPIRAKVYETNRVLRIVYATQ